MKENFEMDTMMLHASEITFKHPKTQNIITIQAGLQPEFQRVLTLLNLKN